MFNGGLRQGFGELYPGARKKAKGEEVKKESNNGISKGKREERKRPQALSAGTCPLGTENAQLWWTQSCV